MADMHDPTDLRTDEEIVGETLKRKEAFAILVRRYEAKLTRYLMRLGVFRKEDIEDLLQNVFLKAYRNLNGFDQGLKFSSWMYRIAHNEAVSFFRSRSSRPEGSLALDGELLLEQMPARTDIEADADRWLDSAGLSKAMRVLEPKYRDVIVLRYFEERDYAEISDILQIPIGSVGTLISRAKKRLRIALPDETAK